MPKLTQPVDDGLYIPAVGQWSTDKHWYVSRYMNAFTTAMHTKEWDGLHYIDLFAGAGIERLKGSKTLEWGSPMLAAQIRFPFTGLHLCEKSRVKHKALTARVSRIRSDSQILHGDANEKIDEIVRAIPAGTLSLAFLDPYGLHLEFETIQKLSEVRADLIIFFPDRLDALRNWERQYLNDPDSNLDRCLGSGADWRSILAKTPQTCLAEELRKLYVRQIGSLGYTEFESRRISAKGHPLYILIFCSRHKFAAKLWQAISNKEPDGQRGLSFPLV